MQSLQHNKIYRWSLDQTLSGNNATQPLMPLVQYI